MGSPTGESAREPVCDLHQKLARPARHQHSAEDDEDQHIARDHLQRLAEHAAGLRPEVQHHRAHRLGEGRLGASEDAGPFRQRAADEEIDDPKEAKTDDERAEKPPGEIERERGCDWKQRKINRLSARQETAVDREEIDDPEEKRRSRKRGQRPVQPAALMQGQEGDGEGENDREAEDQPGRQEYMALEALVASAEPMLLQREALLPPGHLVEASRRGLDQPAHQLAQRPGRGVGDDDDDEGKRQEIGEAPFRRRLLGGRCVRHPPFSSRRASQRYAFRAVALISVSASARMVSAFSASAGSPSAIR